MAKRKQSFGAARKAKPTPADAEALARLVATGDTETPAPQDTSVPVSAGTAVVRKRGTVKRLTAYVDPALAARLRDHCHATGRQLSDVIRAALTAHLDASEQ